MFLGVIFSRKFLRVKFSGKIYFSLPKSETFFAVDSTLNSNITNLTLMLNNEKFDQKKLKFYRKPSFLGDISGATICSDAGMEKSVEIERHTLHNSYV